MVLTAVDRDDLSDGGAGHFAQTIRKIKQKAPGMRVEALTGDFAGEGQMVAMVARSGLDVYAHNVETVEALTPMVRDRRAGFRQSLGVLRTAKEVRPELVTKTSIMLGLGETEDQLWEALRGMRGLGPVWTVTADDTDFGTCRTAESRRRCGDFWTVHEAYEAAHESP